MLHLSGREGETRWRAFIACPRCSVWVGARLARALGAGEPRPYEQASKPEHREIATDAQRKPLPAAKPARNLLAPFSTMIVTTAQLFKHAYGRYAVGAYNINNAEQAMGLFKGCIQSQAPFIIQISKGARKYTDKRMLEAIIRSASDIFRRRFSPYTSTTATKRPATSASNPASSAP